MENDNQKEVAIILTDIQFHVTDPRKPLSPIRTIEKSLRNRKPSRWFNKKLPSMRKDGSLTIPIFENSELAKFIEKLKTEGKRFRIFIPKTGLAMCAGNDTLEYIEAQKKKVFSRANLQ